MWRLIPAEREEPWSNKVDCNGELVMDVKNIYRTLLTRGMKGCYVYFTDKETEEYFREKIEN